MSYLKAIFGNIRTHVWRQNSEEGKLTLWMANTLERSNVGCLNSTSASYLRWLMLRATYT